MATLKKNSDSQSSATVQKAKGLTDTQQWVYGVILFAFAVFLLVSVGSYYFYWANDQSVVLWGDTFKNEGIAVLNYGGKLGATLANYLVGEWFGVFGIVIPIVLIILALRVKQFRPVVLRRSVRISLIIMILGSLSLGYIFGSKWGLFGSGLGGAHGVFVSQWLASLLGVVGEGLLLLLAWILLAVYINRSAIRVVDKVGKGIVDNSMKVGSAVLGQAAELIPHKNTEQTTRNKADVPAQTTADSNDFEVIDESMPLQSEAQSVEGIVVESMGAQTSPGGINSDPSFEIRDSRISDGDEPYMVVTSGAEAVQNVTGSEIIAPWDEQIIIEKPVADTIVDDIQPTDNFQVVDNVGRALSIGGVVESHAVDGESAADQQLQVVMAAHSDAQLSEQDIEDNLYDPTKELSKYQRPPVELLEDHSVDVSVSEEEIYENKNQIVRTLENFGIKIDKIKATIGPTVTLYEIVPSAGVKIAKIKNLEDDIALSLKALGIRIIAPMPGKGTVGIEVPNKDKEIVSMYSVIKTMKFQESKYELPIVLGRTIQNETYVVDLATMPHLLVAGATGQGKSVGLNAIITSLLYKKHPAELKFVLVDPKKVELSLYSKLEKHFLAKMASEDDAIITDTQKVVYTLNSLCEEMRARYDLLRLAEVKKITEYNDKFLHRRLNPNKGHRFMPYIVVVIDEFADMIMTAGRDAEKPIISLAQLARAVGIHLVFATQRPDVKVVTGTLKANFPTRIAFRVMSMIDSRTILDQPGANQLIGRGDMLISRNGEVTRVQCAFIDTPEIERITEFISNQRGYASAYELPDYTPDGDGQQVKNADMSQIDPMFDDVARFVVQNQQGSTSSIQRRFSIGYNRAGRIMDQLEAAGVVGRAEGSKPREVMIVDLHSLESVLARFNAF